VNIKIDTFQQDLRICGIRSPIGATG
jgi:hypothetical protein